MFIINFIQKKKIQNSYEQLEILIPLFNILNIKKRIPNTRGYAASPDYLFEIKNSLNFLEDLLNKNELGVIETIVPSFFNNVKHFIMKAI